jgi:hypothetical protein
MPARSAAAGLVTGDQITLQPRGSSPVSAYIAEALQWMPPLSATMIAGCETCVQNPPARIDPSKGREAMTSAKRQSSSLTEQRGDGVDIESAPTEWILFQGVIQAPASRVKPTEEKTTEQSHETPENA